MKTIVIYCPKHEALKSVKKRWLNIAEALDRHGVEYDFVQSENHKSVERIVTMMIHNGYDNIIIAGGDSALNDACNCLMREELAIRERVCLGVIPNGTMNDFAKFWDFTEDDIDTAIESIKTHRVRKIDAGVMTYCDKDGKKQTKYFLDSVNVGLIAGIQNLRRQSRRILWSRKLSFMFSLAMLAFLRMDYKLAYTINYIEETRSAMTMCIGNALGYGQTPNAVPYNGMLDITILTNHKLTQLFSGISLFLRGKILNHNGIHPYRCREILLELGKGTPVTVDGRTLAIVNSDSEMTISVEQEAINFIIEKP